jgi:hypothetical protein
MPSISLFILLSPFRGIVHQGLVLLWKFTCLASAILRTEIADAYPLGYFDCQNCFCKIRAKLDSTPYIRQGWWYFVKRLSCWSASLNNTSRIAFFSSAFCYICYSFIASAMDSCRIKPGLVALLRTATLPLRRFKSICRPVYPELMSQIHIHVGMRGHAPFKDY